MLSNNELYDMAIHNNIKIDSICYKDEIMKVKKKKNMNIILNLQDSKENSSGTHWVVLIKKANHYVYYDSFGAKPPKVVMNYCRKNLGYNEYICQNINTDTCGYYCFGLIHYLQNHNVNGNIYEASNDYINLFEDNTVYNNDILEIYYKKFIK